MPPSRIFAESEARGPRFIGAGFQKCGSTSLYSMLTEYVPFFVRPSRAKHGSKELHAIPYDRKAHIKDRRAYLKALGPTVPKIHEPLDFTPNYAMRLSSLSNIKLLFPWVKIILTVRDPVDRFYSALDHGKQVGQIDPNMSDEQAFERSSSALYGRLRGWDRTLLSHGLFVPPIQAAYRLFGRGNVFLTSLDLLKSGASQKELARLADFIEMPSNTFGGATFAHVNVSQNSNRPLRDIPRTRRTKNGAEMIKSFYNRFDGQLTKLLEERES